MKYRILIAVLWLPVSYLAAQRGSSLHRRAILVDTHNDVLTATVLAGKDISTRLDTGQSDLVRWRKGGVDVQFFSVWTDEKPRRPEGFFHDANEEIDSLDALVKRHPESFALATTYAEVRRGIRRHRLVALIGVEGGHMIEDDLGKLDSLARRGMRYLTLTWNNSNAWSSSARDESLHPGSLRQKGLNDFGRQVVRRLNELGVMVDLSHTGEQTFYDALAVTSKPVLLSHSSVYALCPAFRNLKDDQIRAVARNGGVICINFYPGFIGRDFLRREIELDEKDKPRMLDSLLGVYRDSARAEQAWLAYRHSQLDPLRPTLADLVDHIDYIVRLVGDDYVGLGADYDGVDEVPRGLEDVTSYPRITEELLRRGYSRTSIRKILGGNVLRVMRANLP
ncbi:MAG TPA: dipeptidase [Chitinophagaceae bacterium]|nr:dipeptidase [Chitinophagaceae bacterium]